MSKLPPLPHWCESGSPFAEQMQAYATAATEPLLQRIAELERQLEEARKQMEAQKDEWLAWEAKRKALEKDAERYRWLTDNKNVPWGSMKLPINILLEDGIDAAIDAAMQKGKS